MSDCPYCDNPAAYDLNERSKQVVFPRDGEPKTVWGHLSKHPVDATPAFYVECKNQTAT